MSLKSDLISFAHSLGFERVGVTTAKPLEREGEYFKRWLAEGRAGEMSYLERDPECRARPAELLPGAKSVIAMAMNYGTPSPSSPVPFSLEYGEGENKPSPYSRERAAKPGEGEQMEAKVSRYAAGSDYHKTIGKRLDSFVRYLQALVPKAECRAFVDTGPLLERALAQHAGLGFIGKNSMLITKGLGSWVFLASVITTLDLPVDVPDERNCGQCRLCIDACPTEAITAPFEIDARRCIPYLTIESDSAIPVDLRPKMGGWIFGCDICQEVCPHNARPVETQESSFRRKQESSGLDWAPTFVGVTANLKTILSIENDEEFRLRFAGSALMRAGREGLLRNACVAAANLGRRDLLEALERLAGSDASSLVREHAAWAAAQLRTNAQAV